MPFSTFFNSLCNYHFDLDDKYVLAGTLKGHDGPINTFTFNSNGTLLASGGDDEEVRIWDVNRLRQSQRLTDPHGRWGQITCVRFINPETPSGADWLCFGTGRGMLALYRKSRRAAEFVEVLSFRVFSVGDSVETFTFDPNHQRLAVSSHYGKIRMFRYQQGKFVELWEDELLDAIPRALFFSDNGHSMSVFAMETGAIFSRDVDTSMTQTTKTLKTAIGYVSQCRATGNILIDNMRDGFDLYPYNRYIPSRTFRVEATKMYVKAGVFGEGGKVVVCGSDHGRLYVFGIGEIQSKQELVHGSRADAIQAIETTTTNGSHLIVSGISSGRCDIRVWRRPVRGLAQRERGQTVERLMVLNVVFFFVFFWLTRETWGSCLKDRYTDLISKFGSGVSHRVWQNAEPEPGLLSPILEEIFVKMNDEEVRKILKMPPRLTEDVLKVDDKSFDGNVGA